MNTKLFRFFLTIALLLVVCLSTASADGEYYSIIPYPGKEIGADKFAIAEDGSLIVQKKGKTYTFINNEWTKTTISPTESTYTVEHTNPTDWIVRKDGAPIYSSQSDVFFDTLYPVNDQLAYATLSDKVYQLDMTTGLRKVVCKISGFHSSDWADGLLVFDNKIYVIQTQIPMLQVIDMDAIIAQGIQVLSVAMASEMDIGNTVLWSAEEKLYEQYPNTLVEISKVSADQCRLNLMADPAVYDLIIADPSLWDDLAKAGIFENLETHESLRNTWGEWIDMSTICRYEGKLYGVLLWEEAEILWVNESLVSLLSNILWPETNWSWNDFLSLARQCCKDLDGDGKSDIYIAYQHMFYPDWNTTYSYSLPVHQAALLYRNGVVQDLDCSEVLDMLDVWKACWDEGLLCPQDGSYENPNNNVVIFAENIPPEWAQYKDVSDIRLTIPGLTHSLRCVPSKGILMSINTHSAHMDQAVAFMNMYMQYGAAEHDYLQSHEYTQNDLEGDPEWTTPNELHETHYITTMQSLYRDDWDVSLYTDMELQFTRFLQGEISSHECVRLWQQKLRMTQME